MCVCVCVLVAQSCLTLCIPMDCSLPGCSGILLARILEWVAIPFSGDLPDPGIEPRSPALQADSLLSEIPGKPFLFLFYIMTTRFNKKTWQSEGTKILVFSVHLIIPHSHPRTFPVPLDWLLSSRWPGSLLYVLKILVGS